MKSSLKKNYLYSLIYRIVILLTPLITAPYISRVLGVGRIGEYSYTYSISHLFLVFAALGVSEYGSRSIARVRDNEEEKNKVFSEILVMQLLLSFIIILFYVFYCFSFAEATELSLIQGINVLATMFDITWFLFGMELFAVTTIRNVIAKIIGVVMILIFVKSPDDLWVYALIMAGSTFIGQISVWPLLSRYVKFVKPEFSNVVKHLLPNIILFLPVIANNILVYLDKVMIGSIIGKNELGWYENADKMIIMPSGIVMALGSVMLPRITNSISQGDNEGVKKLTEKTMLFLAFATSAMGFGIAAVSKQFTPIFFGEGYEPVIYITYFLAPYMVFMSWTNNLKTQFLLPNNMDKVYVRCLLFGSALNIALNFALIPFLGAIGAAAATTFSWVVISVIETYVLRNKIDYKKYILNSVPFFMIGALMAASIWFIDTGNDVITLIVKIAAGAAIYLSLSFVYVYNRHRSILTDIFKRKI